MERLQEEIGRTHPSVTGGTWMLRALSREGDIYERWSHDNKNPGNDSQASVSVLVAGEGVEWLMQGEATIYLWGKRCRVMRYERKDGVRVKGGGRGGDGQKWRGRTT